MTVILTFLACIVGSATECKNISLTFYEITQSQCMVGAQIVLAKYVSTHPNLYIKEYHCTTPNESAEKGKA